MYYRPKIFVPKSSYSMFGEDVFVEKFFKKRLNGIYVKHSGKKIAEIESLMDRDTFLSPEDALKIGLIDEVVEKRPNIK